MGIGRDNPMYKGLYYTVNKEDEKKELVLINNDKKITVKGEKILVFEKIIPLLNGEHNYSQIASMVSTPEDYVKKVIDLLFEKNLLIVNDISVKAIKDEIPELERHFSIYSNSKEDILNELNQIASKTLYIMGRTQIASSLKRNLQTIFNVIIVKKIEDINPTDCDLLIICDFFENSPFLLDINKKCRLNKLRFIKIILENNALKIGPIFSSESLCYECYLSRLYSNNPDLKCFSNGIAVVKENFRENYLPGTIELASGMIKIQLIKLFSKILISDIVTNEYVIRLEDFTSEISPVYALPNCKICYQEVFGILKGGE